MIECPHCKKMTTPTKLLEKVMNRESILVYHRCNHCKGNIEAFYTSKDVKREQRKLKRLKYGTIEYMQQQIEIKKALDAARLAGE